MTVVRCSVCKRLHSSYADNCPDCGRRSRRGWIRVITVAVCMSLTVVALVLTVWMVRKGQ